MPDQKILDYINQQLKNGVSEDGVKKALADVGWQKTFIDEAFASIRQPNISIPIPDDKISVSTGPAAVKVQPAPQQPAPQQPVQGQPLQSAQAQPVPKEPAKNSLPEPEAVLPFKVQPVPKEAAADVFSAVPTDQPQAAPAVQAPVEKNNIPAQNISGQSEKPQQANYSKPEANAVFSNEVPQISELDKAFGQTFGIQQGTGETVPAPAKIAVDPFVKDDKQIFTAKETKNAVFGQIANPMAGLPDMGTDAQKKDAPVSGSKPVSDFASQPVSAPAKTDKKTDEKELDELLDSAGGKPKKKSFIVFLLFGLIGAALLGGAAYAYFFYLEPTPASIFQKMADAAVPIKTAEFSGKAMISVPPAPELGETEALAIGLDFSGVFDATNNEDPVISVNINETDNVMSGSNSVKFETVSAGNALYLKASDFSEASTAELAAYKGQWLKIDGLKILPEFESVFPIYGNVKQAAGIGDVDMTQLIGILVSANKPTVVKFKDKLEEEQVGGTDCRHYGFDIDKDKLKTEVAAALVGADGAEIDNYGKIIDKAAISGEIWIGEKDYLIYKTTYSVAYDGAGDVPAKTNLNITVTGYNGSVSVAVPDQYRPGIEIFYEVASKKEALAKESLALQNDSTRKNDMKLLFEAQKSWYLANKRFYTCSNVAGDCGGKPLNFPVSIGNFLNVTPGDPQPSGEICGQDFVYCSIDNSKSAKNFCYYAKMSDGTFFTASPYGNFIRSTVPANFKECQQGTLVE